MHKKPLVLFSIAVLLLAYAWALYILLGSYIGRRGVFAIASGTVFLLLTFLKGSRFLVRSIVFACSLIVFSILVFSLFEVFPELIPVFHLNSIAYYAIRLDYVPDATFRKRNKPSLSRKISNFRGSDYSPIYGIDVTPTTIDWSMDLDGFRNSRAIARADVALIGDSFVEFGINEADTLGERLKNLTGLTVRNIGGAAWGPNQYLEVLKRYGVKLQPKYALLAFYEGNDIIDIRQFEQWKLGNPEVGLGDVFSASFWRRYKLAMNGIFNYVEHTISLGAVLAYQGISKNARQVHPDVAVLNLHGKYFKRLFFGIFSTRQGSSIQEILSTPEWETLRRILSEFKSICILNNISPIIIYIPTDVHIYAVYSTQDSGENWLKKRERQIALKGVTEKAMTQLAQELHFDLISLTPAFESAAEEGRMLYYPLDSDWNSEGRQEAAEVVAQVLKRSQVLSAQAAKREERNGNKSTYPFAGNTASSQ